MPLTKEQIVEIGKEIVIELFSDEKRSYKDEVKQFEDIAMICVEHFPHMLKDGLSLPEALMLNTQIALVMGYKIRMTEVNLEIKKKMGTVAGVKQPKTEAKPKVENIKVEEKGQPPLPPVIELPGEQPPKPEGGKDDGNKS